MGIFKQKRTKGKLKEHVIKLLHTYIYIRSDQIRSVAQSCPTLCDPMNRSTPGLPVQHQLPEFTETHVHRVNDAIQPSYPLSFPSPPAPNPSQYQSLPTPIFWPGEFHELYSPWGGKELDTTELLSTAQHSL